MITELFPIAVGTYRVPTLSEEERSFIKSQTTYKNIGNKTSKQTFLLNDPILSGLKKQLEGLLLSYLDEIYRPSTECGVEITQSWANYADKKGQYHHLHAHPNSFISGVLYVQASAEDRLNFTKETEKYAPRIYPAEVTPFNALAWWIPVQTNDLLIFPSDLLHDVPPIKEDRTEDTARISLSFNTKLIGTIGDERSLNWMEVS